MPLDDTSPSLATNLTLLKIIFLLSVSGYAIISAVCKVGHEFYKVLSTADKVDSMIFDANIHSAILWIGLIMGAVLLVAIKYWRTFEDSKKQKLKKGDAPPKAFDIRYIIAGVCSIILAIFVSYVTIFFGMDYVYKGVPITQCELAFFIAMFVGAFWGFIIDATLFHGIANATADAKWNKAEELIRTKQVQDAFLKGVTEICLKKGVVDQAQIDYIVSTLAKDEVKDLTDPEVVALINKFVKSE